MVVVFGRFLALFERFLHRNPHFQGNFRFFRIRNPRFLELAVQGGIAISVELFISQEEPNAVADAEEGDEGTYRILGKKARRALLAG